MLNDYPKFEKGQIEDFYNKLPKAEKEELEEYLQYRKARGVNTTDGLKDIRRYLLHIRFILEKDIKKITSKELSKMWAIISGSYLSNNAKQKVCIDLKNFIKHTFRDWSIKFPDMEDIKLGSNERDEQKINQKTIITQEKIEKLVKHENSNFWRAFLLVQFEGALRTIEARLIKWKDIKLNIDGDITEITIYATKTRKARTIYVEQATFYLKKLLEEQENTNGKGVYVFHSKGNKNEPIGKWAVNKWFRRLTEKVLGERGWNYLMRHGRATQLYKLAKENKISKETAIAFMGHSEDMSKTYTHLDTEDIKRMMKEQIFKLEELPPEKKSELEARIKSLEDKMKRMELILKKTK